MRKRNNGTISKEEECIYLIASVCAKYLSTSFFAGLRSPRKPVWELSIVAVHIAKLGLLREPIRTCLFFMDQFRHMISSSFKSCCVLRLSRFIQSQNITLRTNILNLIFTTFVIQAQIQKSNGVAFNSSRFKIHLIF